ncbi:MAG TPA: aldo/keto reductase [Polyangiaceae bacterium]
MKTRKLGKDGANVSAIGLGGMWLSIGDGGGNPKGRPSEADAIKLVEAALASGIDFIDTADVYCLDDKDIGHNERVIGKAVGAKQGITIATKGGLRRPGGSWTRDAKPAHLREACEASLKALGRDVIDLYQLHAPDPKTPIEESVGELAKLRQEGKIARVGLSNVSVDEIRRSEKIVPITSVQNRWNPGDRSPEEDGVLAYCTEHGIAFLPYSPFGGARGATTLGDMKGLAAEAKKRNVSPHRLVLAWMLAKSPVVIPIPGARRIASIEDSAKAAALELSAADVAAIEAAF